MSPKNLRKRGIIFPIKKSVKVPKFKYSPIFQLFKQLPEGVYVISFYEYPMYRTLLLWWLSGDLLSYSNIAVVFSLYFYRSLYAQNLWINWQLIQIAYMQRAERDAKSCHIQEMCFKYNTGARERSVFKGSVLGSE